MPRVRNRERFTWLALAMVAATTVAAEEPTQWLQRMNQALTSRNYDGTFSHWHGGRVETLRIIHRVQDGSVAERLVSLDGSGREFIRSGPDLACYLPDKKTVLVEKRPADESLLGGFPAINEQTANFYDIQEIARTRLNRRDTHVITVTPKDEFRYGYRLWIDETTAMPLKTQLCDGRGHVIEQIVFANLTLSSRIPDSAFKPEVSTEGFQWLRNEAPASAKETPENASVVWNSLKLPPGFRMAARSAQMMPGSNDPVSHLVFSDGLASVSVFLEQGPKDPPNEKSITEESATVGSSSVFSTVMDGRKVTAVGEVPPETLRSIASSFSSQSSSMPSQGPTPVMGPRH
jgi:sigma-E factor negative regulatory protein RseB